MPQTFLLLSASVAGQRRGDHKQQRRLLLQWDGEERMGYGMLLPRKGERNLFRFSLIEAAIMRLERILPSIERFSIFGCKKEEFFSCSEILPPFRRMFDSSNRIFNYFQIE